MNYAEVYVDIKTLGVDHPFDYEIPPNLEEQAKVGSAVVVPFGNRTETGYITRIKKLSSISGKEIKPLVKVAFDVPVFDGDRLKLIYWMAAYYISPVVKIIDFFSPAGRKKTVKPDSKTVSGCLNKPLDNINSPFKGHTMPETVINENSQSFLRCIKESLGGGIFKGFLLKDFNESQKLEIIKDLALRISQTGRKTLVVAPEIADIKNIYSGFNLIKELKACIYNSEKSPSKRGAEWLDICCNKFDVICGTRSSIFLPIESMGIIIVDEADDPSYKEPTLVRYNLKDVALKLAKILKIPCVFFTNSASVSLRYEFSAKSNLYIIDNPVSFAENNLFKKQLVDLKAIDRSREDINISSSMFMGLKKETDRKNKAVIFVNRRGYSSFLICKKCGYIPKCQFCNIAYKYHSGNKKLVCHHCSATADFNGLCPSCKGNDFSYLGTGIEKIEYKLKQRFKNIEIFRIDSDKIKKKDELKKILDSVNSAEAAILLGTQAIANNIKINGITFAGIIDFDSLLNLPDFSINEKVCQILIKLSSLLQNNADSSFLVQTYNVQNTILKSFMASDYNIFYEAEIKNRKELFYPPFSNLVNIIISGKEEKLVKYDIDRLFSEINSKKYGDFLLLGPSQAPFYRVNQYYRWHILVKTSEIMKFNIFLGKILKGFKKHESNKIISDVDPVWIL